eukprot:CAMPEP_0119312778 /NCGR_PEP_ID=MMETSP1333-20130426/27006_1 /TAXON_ID=418940 /ORGANISM="Scyphosphaera apsteinii, Strain RCC1455" /LENGTH=485 /DNA_ID=CAMNT_0007317443 /DNA_START=195 /DNA_END=1653 /DNA_ORIENTATION=-
MVFAHKMLLWLVRDRLQGSCKQLQVSKTPCLSKAAVVQTVRHSQSMSTVFARDVGAGSWTLDLLRKLVSVAPASLREGFIEVDCRLVINRDLVHPELSILAHPALHIRRLVLVKMAGLMPPIATESPAALLTEEDGLDEAEFDSTEEHQGQDGTTARTCIFTRLKAMLIKRGELWYLDTSSGALSGLGIERLVAPILRSPRCCLRWLACSKVPRGSASDAFLSALKRNRSLQTLKLGLNALSAEGALLLAGALRSHPTLECLCVEHNPLLDSGAKALADTLEHNQISCLSLAFTGASDGACSAAAHAIALRRPLRHLNLCGNAIGSDGVSSLAIALNAAGSSGNLHHLSLSTNNQMKESSLGELARVLPASALRHLELAGCGVTAHTCGLIASELSHSNLNVLDLSLNHFGCIGAWALAWALPECEVLRGVNLANCNIGTDGADELAEALKASSIASLDLQGNMISHSHPIGLDARVSLAFQRVA